MLTVADLIWPAFLTPYFFAAMFPISGFALLATEIVVFVIAYRDYPFGSLLAAVLSANLVSSVIGVGLAFALPSGLRKDWAPHQGVDIHAPSWRSYAVASWFVACLLSIIIEYFFIRFVFSRLRLPYLLRTTSAANLASYAVLFAAVKISSHFMS